MEVVIALQYDLVWWIRADQQMFVFSSPPLPSRHQRPWKELFARRHYSH
ncbi:hypothetical protein [Streptosporangium sp. V21-05]